jgi:enolase
MSVIERVRAREILDSRGHPTVEADVVLADGSTGRAATPSGASTGRHEAHELRDGDSGRYRGRGVLRAVANVNDVISPSLRGLDPADQAGLDARLIDLDGTPEKRRLGANALVAVSLAAARAAALARHVPLYRHIAELAGVTVPRVPLPMFNIISGGLHGGRQLDIQDVLAIPIGATSFAEALALAVEVHAQVGDRLRRRGLPMLVSDEGGWAPPLESNEEAVALVSDVCRGQPAEVVVGLDVAATHFLEPNGQYRLAADQREGLDAGALADLLVGWVDRFGVASIEDGLAEDDWAAWTRLTETLGDRVQIVGDDLFVTNVQRLRRGIEAGSANAVLVKVNQAGTLTEALAVVAEARRAGLAVVVSARSGETEDSFLADLAVGVTADQIKVGSVTRSSRLAKWNQLIRIAEDLPPDAYAGRAGLPSLNSGRAAS